MKNRDYLIVMKQILQLIDEGVHVVDPEGNSVVYNRSMAMLEKMESQDVLKKPFAEVFKNVEESTLMQALEKRQTTMRKEQTYLNKDGREITTVNTTVPVIEDGRLIGAIEIAKNITDVQKMSRTILELRREMDQPQRSKEHKIKKYSFDNLYGQNEAFLATVALAKKAARINASVVIYGETGTGKELIAQSIHFASDRQNKPFLAQNCAALPANLLESILFGTAKGGFTGAVDRAGMFEQANGGTLLLDEINSMPLDMQVSLLRVLEERSVMPLGAKAERKVDIRVIAATNRDLKAEINKGNFRSDLYFRLAVIPIYLPPLRERREDIASLARVFIKRICDEYGLDDVQTTQDFYAALDSYPWRGNVRELRNTLEYMLLMSNGDIINSRFLEKTMSSVTFNVENGEASSPKAQDGKKAELIQALEACGYNKSKAAQLLGISRKTLYVRMSKYGLEQ